MMVDVEYKPLSFENQTNQKDGLNLSGTQIFGSGTGNEVAQMDRDGFFVGGGNYTAAPWKVNYSGVQKVGANSEIVLDGPNKKITVGTGNEIVLDGSAGTITTNRIVDSTYGFYGCFVKVFTTTSTSGTTAFTVAPQNGGLVHVAVNMADTGSPANFIDVPSWNGISANWECYISGGNYIVNVYNSNIHNDYFALTKVFVTVFFNSLETAGF